MATTTVTSRSARGRLGALLYIAALATASWVYLWLEARSMKAMPGMNTMTGGVQYSPWSPYSLVATFVMWAVMMVGMMLPSAAPAILLYETSVKKRRSTGSTLPATWVFIAGYLFVWTAFSFAFTFLQSGLQEGGLLNRGMASASTWLTGGVLITAGAYQWLPVKRACLDKCRSPLHLFMFHWRPGAIGAFRMGAEHGGYCVGCCWALMLLLFAAGVMNLLWIAVIAGFVFVEKVLSGGAWIGKLGGGALVAAGAIMMVRGLF